MVSKEKKMPASSKAGIAAESAETPEEAVRVLRHFRQVFNAVKTHFQQVEKRAGLGGAQIWALSVIEANPALGVNDLAQAMDVHQTTASNLLKGLLKLELVRVDKSKADRRAVQLHILPAGRAVLKKAPGPFAGVLPQALAHLDKATLKRLDQDLSKLLGKLKPAKKAALSPLADL